jgi:ParB family transcriptional regulator, chromosome partitioning protein
MKVRLTDITVKQGRRAVDESKVRELSQSMAEIGLINPITVTQDKTLITGAHRLAAAKLLGWTEIEATVSELDGLRAELAEIDENLMRNDLHYIDRGNSIKRRCEILRMLGLMATAGRPTKNQSESDGFLTNKELANKIGVSETQFKIERQIARDILPEAQEAIKAADLPKTDALKIARMEPEKQVEAVRQMAAKPHVTNNSGENEWYTPSEFINSAREVMGSIDLDPASCEHANKTVAAAKYFSIDDDGLSQEWRGNVWMNPPYSGGLISKFIAKLNESVENGAVTQAVVLVNNATETQWFAALVKNASAIVFPTSRIRYLSVRGEENTPLQGQAFVYIGNNPWKFLEVFKAHGWGATL